MFGDFVKATVGVVTLPIDIVKDTINMGGALDDTDSAVITKLESICENLNNIAKPRDT